MTRAPRVGGLLGEAVTVIAIVRVAAKAGEPLSVTRTVTEKLPT